MSDSAAMAMLSDPTVQIALACVVISLLVGEWNVPFDPYGLYLNTTRTLYLVRAQQLGNGKGSNLSKFLAVSKHSQSL